MALDDLSDFGDWLHDRRKDARLDARLDRAQMDRRDRFRIFNIHTGQVETVTKASAYGMDRLRQGFVLIGEHQTHIFCFDRQANAHVAVPIDVYADRVADLWHPAAEAVRDAQVRDTAGGTIDGGTVA